MRIIPDKPSPPGSPMTRLGSIGSFTALLLGGSLLPSHVSAEVRPSDTTAAVSFHIPARPLREALAEFTQQAGIRVELRLTGASDLRSQAVVGSFTPPEGLRRLIAETGLTVRFHDEESAV